MTANFTHSVLGIDFLFLLSLQYIVVGRDDKTHLDTVHGEEKKLIFFSFF